MPASSYCSECNTPWPFGQDYRTCPQCGEATAYASREPLFGTDAQWLAAHTAFERFYVEHDLERQREGRLSPDSEGRLEARRIIEQMRDLEARVGAA